jgi:hypothetical protein
MFKNTSKKLLFAVIATVVIGSMTFFACKKDRLLDESNGGFKTSANSEVLYMKDFDPNGEYFVKWGWFNGDGRVNVVSNSSFVPEGGKALNEIWNIHASFSPDGANSFTSFCANGWSNTFAEGEAYVVKKLNPNDPIDLDLQNRLYDATDALNYILCHYGSVDAWNWNAGDYSVESNTKIISQIVVWILILDQNWYAVDINEILITDFGGAGQEYIPYYTAAVQNVLGNYKTDHSRANGEIMACVMLVGKDYPTDILNRQPQVVPIWYDPTQPFLGGIGFTKMKLVNGQQMTAGAGEFEFDLFMEQNDVYDLFIRTICTDNYGRVSITDLPEGNYVFKEKEYANWKLDIPGDGLYFTIAPDGTATWADQYFTGTVVNKPKIGPSYGTVTATKAGNVPNIIASLNPKNGNPQDPQSYNAGVVWNSNHFVYAEFTRAELEAGAELDFVVGNKFDIIGHGTAKIVDGNIEVTIDNFYKGEFGVIAFNKPCSKNMPKNGNIHSQKEADLIKDLGATTGFNHNNKLVVSCPTGNTIYLYIHCGTIQFYL